MSTLPSHGKKYLDKQLLITLVGGLHTGLPIVNKNRQYEKPFLQKSPT